MRILKAGALYFGVAFAFGFVLGTIRVIWVVPRLGERTAELMEAPLMLAVTILAAQWVVRRFAVPAVTPLRLGMGLIGLGWLLVAELAVVLLVRGLTLSQCIASRDIVPGTVYLVLIDHTDEWRVSSGMTGFSLGPTLSGVDVERQNDGVCVLLHDSSRALK